MLAKDINVGSTYRCKVGARLALVRVVNDRGGSGRRFTCETQDTHRTIRASAAKLRPIPGTDAAEAERARLLAAAQRRAARGPRPFAGPTGTDTVEAQPLPGVIERVSVSPVLRLSESNHDTIRRIVDRVHVAEPFARVARSIRRAIGSQVQWQTIPRGLRRGILFAAAQRHAKGRSMYRLVMGHAPLPSERMVAAAVGAACGLGPMPR